MADRGPVNEICRAIGADPSQESAFRRGRVLLHAATAAFGTRLLGVGFGRGGTVGGHSHGVLLVRFPLLRDDRRRPHGGTECPPAHVEVGPRQRVSARRRDSETVRARAAGGLEVPARDLREPRRIVFQDCTQGLPNPLSSSFRRGSRAISGFRLPGGKQVVLHPEDDDGGDFLPIREELGEGPGLGRRDGMVAGAGGKPRVVAREVEADVDASRGVLIPLTVGIVVHSLGQQAPAAALSAGRIGDPHQTRIVRVLGPFPGRIRDSHHRDQAVSVEVVRTVLVDHSVPIVIMWRFVPDLLPDRSPPRSLGGIRTQQREDKHRGAVQERGDRRITAVLPGQTLDEGEGHVDADPVRRPGTGHDQKSWPGVVGSAPGNARQGNSPSTRRLADLNRLDSIRAGQPFELASRVRRRLLCLNGDVPDQRRKEDRSDRHDARDRLARLDRHSAEP